MCFFGGGGGGVFQSVDRFQHKPSGTEGKRVKKTENVGWMGAGVEEAMRTVDQAGPKCRAGREALLGWAPQLIYRHDVSGSSPAFSLVVLTTCLLKPPLG